MHTMTPREMLQRCQEIDRMGAAYLAGLGVGYWKNVAEIATQWQTERRFESKMKAAQRQGLLSGWNRALERTKGA